LTTCLSRAAGRLRPGPLDPSTSPRSWGAEVQFNPRLANPSSKPPGSPNRPRRRIECEHFVPPPEVHIPAKPEPPSPRERPHAGLLPRSVCGLWTRISISHAARSNRLGAVWGVPPLPAPEAHPRTRPIPARSVPARFPPAPPFPLPACSSGHPPETGCWWPAAPVPDARQSTGAPKKELPEAPGITKHRVPPPMAALCRKTRASKDQRTAKERSRWYRPVVPPRRLCAPHLFPVIR